MFKRKTKEDRPTIDLTGPEGNAFVLLGYAKKYAKQLGIDSNQIIEKMTSGDYVNLVEVFGEYFGEYVNIILPETPEFKDFDKE